MLKTRIIPTLLRKDLGLVKGQNFKNLRRVTDVMPLIKIYNKRDVDELIFLDVEASINKKKINMDFISSIAKELNIPFSFGGGIKNFYDAKNILYSGADKIVINTSIYENLNLIDEISENIGAQSIIISIDVKKIDKRYICFSHSGSKNCGFELMSFLESLSKKKIGELMLCSIDHEGTMKGYDLNLIEKVSKKINIPLIASGGAGSYEDMHQALKAGASAVAAGAIFHFTELTPTGAKKYLHNLGVNVRDGFKY
jgi:cyclase